MSITSKENHGKPISKELSRQLQLHTDMQDVINIAVKHGISSSLLKQVRSRRVSMTERSSEAVQDLYIRALENCKWRITESKRSIRILKKIGA